MPKLKLSCWIDRKIKKQIKKHYDRQVEISISVDGVEIFRGHKDDSVVNGIIRANPGCIVEWVDKSRSDEIILRGIK